MFLVKESIKHMNGLEDNQSAAIYDGSSWSLQLTLNKKLQSGAISRHETAPNEGKLCDTKVFNYVHKSASQPCLRRMKNEREKNLVKNLSGGHEILIKPRICFQNSVVKA